MKRIALWIGVLGAAGALFAHWHFADGTVKWTFKTGEDIYGPPAVARDGTIYVASDALYALSPDGRLKWKFATSAPVRGSLVMGDDGTIYVATEARPGKKMLEFHVYAVSSTGFEIWNTTVSGMGGYDGSLAIGKDGSLLVLGLRLQAFHPEGASMWTCECTGNVRPVVGADGTIYLLSANGDVFAVNGDSGAVGWKFNVDRGINSSPSIGSDGTIYISSSAGQLFALAPEGTLKWVSKTGGDFSAPATAPDGTLFMGGQTSAREGLMRALRAVDGRELWTFPVGGGADPALLGSDGQVIAAGMDGSLYGLTSGGKQQWVFHAESGWLGVPALAADGTVFVGGHDGVLYALRSSSRGLLRSSWPKFAGDAGNSGRPAL
jgi:outer membrane protein assembly factor BamB